MRDLTTLPPELILLVAEQLPLRSLPQLIRCNHTLHGLLSPVLYRTAIATSSDTGYSSLVHCAAHDNYSGLLLLLQYGANPHVGTQQVADVVDAESYDLQARCFVREAEAETLVHTAANTGSTTIMDYLLNYGGLSPWALDSESRLPVESAARYSQAASIQTLLVAMELSNPGGVTYEVLNAAFVAAAEEVCYDAIALLLAYHNPHNPAETWGPDILGLALHIVIREEKDELVQLLLQNNADPDRSPGWFHPLFKAAKSGNAAIVKMLLDAGVEPDIPHQRNRGANETALVTAAKLATGIGMDPLVFEGGEGESDYEEWYEWKEKMVKGGYEVAKVLLEAGASVDWAKFLIEGSVKVEEEKELAIEFLNGLQREMNDNAT